MAFSATKMEWSSLYSLLWVLAHGEITWGDDELVGAGCSPLVRIVRDDVAGRVIYSLQEGEIVALLTNGEENRISCQEALTLCDTILRALRENQPRFFEVEGADPVLEALAITDFPATSSDQSEFTVFYSDTLLGGECALPIRTRSIPASYALLAANRAGNLKYSILHVKLSNPEANKINRIDGARARLNEVLRLGGRLKYATTENKFFGNNLFMTDLHFPKLLAEMVRIFFVEGISSVSEVTEELKIRNPYKINDELITKYNFYEYKVKQFLFSLAAGMKPTKIFRGTTPPLSHLVITRKGEVMGYPVGAKAAFENHLYYNAHFTLADDEAHKFGWVEKENGEWYIKLNTEITLKD